MTTFCKRYDIQYGIKLSLKNIGDHITGNTKIYSIPLYLLWKLDDWLTLEKSTETFDFNKFADIDTLISEIKENQS